MVGDARAVAHHEGILAVVLREAFHLIASHIVTSRSILSHVEQVMVQGLGAGDEVVVLDGDFALKTASVHGMVAPVLEDVAHHVDPAVAALQVGEAHGVDAVDPEVVVVAGLEAAGDEGGALVARLTLEATLLHGDVLGTLDGDGRAFGGLGRDMVQDEAVLAEVAIDQIILQREVA